LSCGEFSGMIEPFPLEWPWGFMTLSTSLPVVLAMTGASGAAYGVRTLHYLLAGGYEVHLTLSDAATQVFREELGWTLALDRFDAGTWMLPDGRPAGWNETTGNVPGNLVYHHYRNYSAGIASGSFRTAGMVICPCSMGTLASVANGLSTNLIHRAADVHLKERRKLVLVPRETPLSSIALQNLKTVCDAGGVILPAMPGFYHRPQSIDDLIDFVAVRICDQLGVPVPRARRWGTPAETD